MGKEAKTNAMRMLERAKIAYEAHEYPHEEGVAVDGVRVAESMGQNPDCVFKTLVTQGADKNYYVFVIPIDGELDLKKAAKAVGQKSLSMIPVKEINAVTGYIRGGCTAIGMKKQYKTVIHKAAMNLETMIVSGGRIGSQIELKPEDLKVAVNAEFSDVLL